MHCLGSWLCSQQPPFCPVLSRTNKVHTLPPYPNSWKIHLTVRAHLHLCLPRGILPSCIPHSACLCEAEHQHIDVRSMQIIHSGLWFNLTYSLYEKSRPISKMDNISKEHTSVNVFWSPSGFWHTMMFVHSRTENLITWSKNPKHAPHLNTHPEIGLKSTLQQLKTVHATACTVPVININKPWIWVSQNVYILLHTNEFIKHQPHFFLCWIFLANLLLKRIKGHTYVHNFTCQKTYMKLTFTLLKY